MSIFRDFFVKEKPFFTGIARGFGFGGGGGAAAIPNVPFNARIIIVAGGGSGGTTQGGGGGGAGGMGFFPFAITLGTSYPFFVGHGGETPGPGGDNDGNSGEDTIWNNDPTNYKVGGGAYGGAPGGGGPGKAPAGNGGGGGRDGPGGSGSGGGAIPGPNQPYVFGAFAGGAGHPGPGTSGGNQGGGGGGSTQNGGAGVGPGTPGTRGGGPGGNGKAVPADYLPDTFTATGAVAPGDTPDQFLGMATSQPAVLRRTFSGGGGGGGEHGCFPIGKGGDGGGGHGAYGSPSHPYSASDGVPPAGPPGFTPSPVTPSILLGEPGYNGRGGGGGGGGYTGPVNWSGSGGAGLILIQMPSSHNASVTTPGTFPDSYHKIHTSGDKKYVVLVALSNTQDLPGSITFS